MMNDNDRRRPTDPFSDIVMIVMKTILILLLTGVMTDQYY